VDGIADLYRISIGGNWFELYGIYMMNTRRYFLRALGLAPLLGASAVAAYEDRSNEEPLEGYPELSLSRQKNRCGMTVGQDNNLWLKINGNWKRVVTE